MAIITSTGSPNSEITTVSDTIGKTFVSQLEDAGLKASTAKGDVSDLAAEVLAYGTQSTETASAQAQLIADLEKSGLNVQTAARMVDGFIKELGQIPRQQGREPEHERDRHLVDLGDRRPDRQHLAGNPDAADPDRAHFRGLTIGVVPVARRLTQILVGVVRVQVPTTRPQDFTTVLVELFANLRG